MVYILCYFHLKTTNFIPFISYVIDHSGLINDSYVLNSDLCKKDNIKLLILVFSVPKNFISREAIRKTWGYTKISSISIGFLLGRVDSALLQSDIKKEFEANGDIIQDDSFLDDYHNLTAKAISMLKYATLYCKGVKGVFRAADDIWLNQEKALELLNSNFGSEGIYGVLLRKMVPIRNPKSKWYMPWNRYNQTYYPDYIQGHAFLVIQGKGRNVFELMVNASKFIYFVQIEDVDITGFMADALKIKRFHRQGFHQGKVIPLNETIYVGLITSHHINDVDMSFLWSKMKNKPKKSYNGMM